MIQNGYHMDFQGFPQNANIPLPRVGPFGADALSVFHNTESEADPVLVSPENRPCNIVITQTRLFINKTPESICWRVLVLGEDLKDAFVLD